MSLKTEYNRITLKRISGDIKQFLENEPENIKIYPNPDNVLEIYFLIKGERESNFNGGEYICKLQHNPQYPMKAPDYYVMTPNGRFEVNKKICLTNSGYHQNDWSPAAWNLLTLLNGFHSIWHSDVKEDKIGIAHLNNSKDKILDLASKSINFNKSKLSDLNEKFIE